MREVEMMRKYNYDHKKAHDLLKEEFVKDLLKENKLLTRQLSYIRSGEYLNQLKFERNMLEDVVSKGEVSEIDKAFIDMTHRNTELLEENQKLKERIDYLERSNIRKRTKANGDTQRQLVIQMMKNYIENDRRKSKDDM